MAEVFEPAGVERHARAVEEAVERFALVTGNGRWVIAQQDARLLGQFANGCRSPGELVLRAIPCDDARCERAVIHLVDGSAGEHVGPTHEDRVTIAPNHEDIEPPGAGVEGDHGRRRADGHLGRRVHGLRI